MKIQAKDCARPIAYAEGERIHGELDVSPFHEERATALAGSNDRALIAAASEEAESTSHTAFR